MSDPIAIVKPTKTVRCERFEGPDDTFIEVTFNCAVKDMHEALHEYTAFRLQRLEAIAKAKGESQ